MSFVVLLFFVLLFLAGANLIVRGLMGTASYSDPSCRACGYDLRTFGERPTSCAECGADLTPKRAIRFAERTRSPMKIIAGAALILLVPVLGFGMYFVARNVRMPVGPPQAAMMPQQLGTMTTPQLLATVPAGVSQPWVWNELKSRLQQGTLTGADVDTAIGHLTTHVAAQATPTRLGWPDDFIKQAMQRELISEASLRTLLLAFHGDTIELDVRRRVQADTPGRISLRFPNRWQLMDEKRVIGVTAVRVAGQDASAQALPIAQSRAEMTVRITGLPPGEHTVEVDAEWRIYAPGVLNSGTIGPPASWPRNALISGRGTIKGTVTVLAAEAMLPEAIDAPSRAADVQAAIRVQRVYTYEDKGASVLAADITIDPVTDVPLNMQAVIVIDGVEYDLGSLAITGSGNGWSSSGGFRPVRLTQSLPPDVRRASVEFRPRLDRPWTGEQFMRIWGQPVRFDDLPIERTELPADDG